MSRLGVLALPLLVGAAGVAGCGGRDDETTVRKVSEGFYAAVDSKDGSAACARLGRSTVMKLEKDEMSACPKAVLGLKLSGSRAGKAIVYGGSARVDLRHGDSVFLGETPQGWKVSAAGCKPQPGEEQPYECEVED